MNNLTWKGMYSWVVNWFTKSLENLTNKIWGLHRAEQCSKSTRRKQCCWGHNLSLQWTPTTVDNAVGLLLLFPLGPRSACCCTATYNKIGFCSVHLVYDSNYEVSMSSWRIPGMYPVLLQDSLRKWNLHFWFPWERWWCSYNIIP